MTQRFGFKIKTQLSFDELDNVLGQYCQASYQISIGGLDDSGSVRKKIMIIYFEKQEDRDRIKHLFTVRAAKQPMPGAAAKPPVPSPAVKQPIPAPVGKQPPKKAA